MLEQWPVRSMEAADCEEVDKLFRLAFAEGLDPAAAPDLEERVYSTRLHTATKSLVVEHEGKLIGLLFAVAWGTLGNYGPLAVHPDYQNRGVAQSLLTAAVEAFTDCDSVRIYTDPKSYKHHHLYMKYALYPHFLTYVMSVQTGTELCRQVSAELMVSDQETETRAYGQLEEAEQLAALEDIKKVFSRAAAVPGLDLTAEVKGLHKLGIGETILLYNRKTQHIVAAAIIHCGEGSECGPSCCYAKFGVAWDELGLADLLTSIAAYAKSKKARSIEVGVNISNKGAFKLLLKGGFKVQAVGLCMIRGGEGAAKDEERFFLNDLR